MLGDKIKQLRLSLGISQTDFAKRLFVTPAAVSQWEKGLTMPDTERLLKISKEFAVPLDYFSDMEYTETELITQHVLAKLDSLPKTAEARIVSGGMDKLPKEQREQILNVVRAMFAKNPGLFAEKEGEDNGTGL